MRGIARVLCVILAVLGVAPFAGALVVRSDWARAWAVRETERALRQEGIVATYDVTLELLPLALDLKHVTVESNDGGGRALACNRIRIRPKLFGMLAGKIAIDQVELDEPIVRLVMQNGELTNLSLKPRQRSTGTLHAPFGSFAATDASVDLQVDAMHLRASSLDLDVTTEDDPVAGSTFEIAVRVGRASIQRTRTRDDGSISVDDDALCSIDGRVSLQPHGILVRRLEGAGAADLAAEPGTTPSCDLPADDKRRVEVSLGHLRATFPQGPDDWPEVDGHVAVRVPLALAGRLANIPDVDGWVRVDADLRYARGNVLPDLSGTLEAHDLRLEQYAFARDLHSELSIHQNVFSSPKTTLSLGDGTVTLTDSVVSPLSQGVKLERTQLDATGVNFTALLRALGVHPHSYVAWDVRELHAPLIAGTLVPLKLDGDFTGKTYGFGIYDRPAEDPARERIFGFAEAQIAAHLAVRPDALKFMDVHASLPKSRVDGGLVSIGFHNDVRIDVPHLLADFDDMSPVGTVPIHGKLQGKATVGGTFHRPELEGDVQSIGGFGVADVAFGDVSGGHVKVDVQTPEVLITGAHVKRRESLYDVPTARLRFGGPRGFMVDAVGSSAAFGLRDLLSMFSLEDDPRFADLDATLATTATVHVALGGPEDTCGGGYLGIDAKAHLANVFAYGERFAQGESDVSLRWYDRQQGIAGADVDVRSFVLSKVAPPVGTRAGATGTLLGSASLRRGGGLSANIMVEGIPLSRVDSLGALQQDVEGSISGVAHVTGDLDDFHPDAGFVARAELDVAATRARGVALPGSHLDVRFTHHLSPQTRAIGKTKCGAAIAPPFDRQAYAADASSHGEWTINGDLLGGTAHASSVIITRARAPRISGRVSLRGLDLGALARIAVDRQTEGGAAISAPTGSLPGGQIWGELIVDEIPLDHPSLSRARLFLGPTFVSRGGQKLTLQPPREPLTLENDTLTTPPLQVTLDTPDGFRGGFLVSGAISKATTDPTFALEARLDPVDLAVLQRFVPKVDHASGTVQGDVRVTGKGSSPIVAGEIHAVGDAIEIHGWPSAINDLHLDARATATQLSFSGRGKFAGGTVVLDGSMPVRGLEVGALASHVVASQVRLSPADGVTVTFDADLNVNYATSERGAEGSTLPRVTGDVVVSSFAYARPIALTTDLTQLGTRARRTEVDAYDPSLDFLSLDLRLRSRAPLVIKNNLVEAQLAIVSGTLDVTGTNQRIGLRGALRTLPGGRFHFQQSDFEVRQGLIRFDEPTRVAPNVDVTAVTEYRRYTDTSASAAAGVGTGGGTTAASTGSTRGGSLWRITLHAYGDADNLRVDMTSEPTLSHEDIVLLLTVGMTRAELDQLQGATSLGYSLALNYLGETTGADRAVKQALPIIDDFRFGSAYSTVTGKTEPQLTVGKRLSNDLRANVTTGLSQDRELRSNIEWRLNNRLSVQGTYDNINDVSSSTLGNLGVDLRWRLEFE